MLVDVWITRWFIINDRLASVLFFIKKLDTDYLIVNTYPGSSKQKQHNSATKCENAPVNFKDMQVVVV